MNTFCNQIVHTISNNGSHRSTTTNIVKSLIVISSNSSLQLAGLVSVQISYSDLCQPKHNHDPAWLSVQAQGTHAFISLIPLYLVTTHGCTVRTCVLIDSPLCLAWQDQCASLSTSYLLNTRSTMLTSIFLCC